MTGAKRLHDGLSQTVQRVSTAADDGILRPEARNDRGGHERADEVNEEQDDSSHHIPPAPRQVTLSQRELEGKARLPPGQHDTARAFHVVGDRCDELVDRVELHLVAQPLPELHGERVTS